MHAMLVQCNSMQTKCNSVLTPRRKLIVMQRIFKQYLNNQDTYQDQTIITILLIFQ